MVAEAVPADSARLELPLDSLLALPLGAAYETGSGRAHARAYVKAAGEGPQVVYVDAWCDSLARLVSYYESREQTSSGSAKAETSRTQDTARGEKEHPPNGILTVFILFIAGTFAGAVTTLLIKRKRKRQ